ncbi:hypothetical protein ACRRTK_006099 [Alexandromys fortis]
MLKSSGKRKPQLESISIRLISGQACGAFSGFMIAVRVWALPAGDSATPG